MPNIISDEEFNKLPGSPSKVISDAEFKSMLEQATPEKPSTSIWDNLVAKTEARADTVGNIQRSNMSEGSKRLQTFGQGAGVGADIVMAGFEKAGSYIPEEIKTPVIEGAGKAMQTVGELGSKIPGVSTLADKYVELEQTNPELTGNIGAVGNIANLALSLEGASALPKQAAGAVTKTKDIAFGIGKNVASKASPIIGKVAPKVEEIAKTSAEFGTAQTFGLKPETVRNIIKNPDLFTPEEMAKINDKSVFTKVLNEVEARKADISETGKAYEPIRKRDVRADNAYVTMPKNEITPVLEKYGIKLDEKGKIVHDLNSAPMSSGDISQIQKWLDDYASTELHTPNSFLNARQATGKIANFQSGTTDVASKIGKDLYAKLNEVGRPQIKGLEELDTTFAPKIKQYDEIKSAIFDKKGNIKPNAISTITNLTGKGKEQLLAKMEKIIPGITKEVNILKSIKDIEFASSNKTGTYFRPFIGAGGGAMMAGPLGAIIGMIMTSPKMGVSLIRTYAKYKNIPASKIKNIVSKMESGKRLVGQELDIVNQAVDNASKKLGERALKAVKGKGGMNLEDVSGGKASNEIADTMQRNYDRGGVLDKINAEKNRNNIALAKQSNTLEDFYKKFPKFDKNKLKKIFIESRKK